MSQKHSVYRLIECIEADLARFYGFTPQVNCGDFLHAADRNSQQRGCILLREEPETDTLEVAIRLHEAIMTRVSTDDPLQKLSNNNLDAFCVIAEEVSHFHMICNRAVQKRGVSQLELEIQGEIDKLLLAASIMHSQSGDAYLLPLVRKIFDEALFINDDPIYQEANRYAADFWYGFLTSHRHRCNPLNDRELRFLLRQSYASPLTEKLQYLDRKRAS